MATITNSYPTTPHHVLHEIIARVAAVFEFDTDHDPESGEIYLDPRHAEGEDESYYTLRIQDGDGKTAVAIEGNDRVIIDQFFTTFEDELASLSRPLPSALAKGGRSRNRGRNSPGMSAPSNGPPAQAPVETWVSERQPLASAAPAQPEEKPASKKNWTLRIAGACALAWLFWTDSGQDFTREVLGNMFLETDIAKYDCGMIGEQIKGREMRSLLGARWEMVTVDMGREMERTPTSLTCSAEVLLDDGRSMDVAAQVRKGGSDREVLFEVRPRGL